MTQMQGDIEGVADATARPQGASDNLLQIIWRQWRVVGVVVTATVVMAVMYLLVATPVYTSQARLYVEHHGSALTGQGGASSEMAVTYRQTQGELLQTAPILADALERSADADLQMFASVDDPIAWLQKHLAVEVGKKSDLISLSINSPHADEATVLVQSILDAYLSYNAGHNRSTTDEQLTDLSKEREDRESEHAALLTQIQQFQRGHNVHSFEDPEKLTERMRMLSDAMTKAQMQRMEAEAAYNVERAMLKEPDGIRQLVEDHLLTGGGANDPEYRQLQEDMHALQRNLAGLRRRWGSNHKLVSEGETSVAFLVQRLNDKRMRIVAAQLSSLSRKLAASRESERQIGAEYDRHRERSVEVTAMATELGRMKTRMAQLEDRREELDSRIQELSVSRSAAAVSVSVLEPAHALSKPAWPRPAQVLGLGLVGGGILGVLLALWRELRGGGFRSSDDVRTALGLAVICTVPRMAEEQSPLLRAQIVQIDPSSAAAEAYRDIRTMLFFSQKTQSVRTMLIASATEADGESTVASNLPIAIAQVRKRVLLIDADMRQATQHERFQIDGGYGLSSVLSGQCSAEQAIRRTSVPNLDILIAGPLPDNPAELLNSQALVDLIENMKDRYDYLVIDSAPVMSVTDARIVAAHCDTTLMVLRPQHADREACHQACRSLEDVGAHLMGVIVNDLSGRFSYPRKKYYGKYGRKDNLRGEPAPSTVESSDTVAQEYELIGS